MSTCPISTWTEMEIYTTDVGEAAYVLQLHRVLALQEKAVKEADDMGIPFPSDTEFFNRFAAACNGAVTPLIRKQLKIFHDLEHQQVGEEGL